MVVKSGLYVQIEYNKEVIFGLFQLKMLNQIEHEIALITYDTKVVNVRKVREVQEGATCFCDKKLSKLG